MKKTIGAQVADFMAAKNMKSADMAVLVGTSRQNIEGLVKLNRFPRGYIEKLAEKMETTVDTLIAGNYVPPLADMGKLPIDDSETNGNIKSRQPIPTNAMFNSVNLASTILLLGSLLAKMDSRSRRMMGMLLTDLADAPDDAQDVADKAASIAGRQKAVTSNKALDTAIQGKEGATFETRPVPLE